MSPEGSEVANVQASAIDSRLEILQKIVNKISQQETDHFRRSSLAQRILDDFSTVYRNDPDRADFVDDLIWIIPYLPVGSFKVFIDNFRTDYENQPDRIIAIVDQLIWKLFYQTGIYPSPNITQSITDFPDDPGKRDLIGRGAFGTVYHAKMHGKRVAVKILDKAPEDITRQMALDPDRFKWFFREIRVWQSISRHKNVLPLSGYFFRRHGNTVEFGLVAPFAEKYDLLTWLKNEQPNDKHRYRISLEIAQGLLHLHEHKPNAIVHGDLRASNILITGDGTAVLADFGLAKAFVSAPSSLTLISPIRSRLNTRWLAPELISNYDSPRTRESDVFSFGRTVYELFTGEVPFSQFPTQSDNSIELAKHQEILKTHILGGNCPHRPETLPDEIWSLLEQCWSLTPRDRLSARDIVAWIEKMRPNPDTEEDDEEDW